MFSFSIRIYEKLISCVEKHNTFEIWLKIFQVKTFQVTFQEKQYILRWNQELTLVFLKLLGINLGMQKTSKLFSK